MAAPVSHGYRVLPQLICKFSNKYFIRNMSRATIRNPTNVFSAKEAKKIANKGNKLRKIEELERVGRDTQKLKQTENDESLDIPPYVKLDGMDKEFTKLLVIVKSRKGRKSTGKILLEGRRLIQDAIQAGVKLELIYFTRDENLKHLVDEINNFPDDVKIYKLIYRNMKVWSDLTTCPGIMGVFKMPDYNALMLSRSSSLGLTVICDNIREPGNLGAILRCAAGVGCDRVILSKGCVDLWEPKVLRSAAGAHFRVPVVTEIGWEHMENYCSPTTNFFLADNHLEDEDNDNFKKIRKTIGAELTLELDNEVEYHIDEKGNKIMYDPNYLNKSKMELFKNVGTEKTLYHDACVDPNEEVTVVIGGETEGLSGEANRLAHKFNGKRLFIPLHNGVESLNCSVATGIVLYELRKKMTESVQSISVAQGP